MLRLLYAFLVGIVGAGIVHIAVILMVPYVSDSSAWSRLALAADFYRTVRLDPEQGRLPLIRSSDPLFSSAACRFNLGDGPVRIGSEGAVPYWSASVYDRAGQNIYSLNDHTSVGGVLDFVVLTPAQMIAIRKDISAENEQSVFVETEIEEGIAVIRVFVPDQTWRPIVSDYLDSISCEPI